MKINKRLTIKGDIDYEAKKIICIDKDLGEVEYSFDDVFLEFNGLEATLTLSHDKIVESK